jgi:hypothetical protein
MANIFDIILVVTAIALVAGGAIAVIAPGLGVAVPDLPGWPTFASNLNWTISLTNMSGISSFFITIGGALVYFLSFLAYGVAIIAVSFTLLGFVPWVATALSAIIFILFAGSLLMFLRGGSGESK